MNELIEAIKAWPIIIQGALGSALFWLVLVLAQWARTHISAKYSLHSRDSRLTWLVNEQTKIEACTAASGIPQIETLAWLFYRACRPFLKALMWLVYGLIMDSIVSPGGVIAYIVCISYLLKAFQIVGPIEDQTDLPEKLKKINDEIDKLQKA
jgi:hypothetical protein